MAPLSGFHRLAALGYGDRLIPVIPPDAPVSSHSRLAALLDKIDKGELPKSKDPRGKAPGVRGFDGLWRGFRDWQHYPTTDEDLSRWSAAGANVGMRCGPGEGGWLCAFDADTLSRDWARVVFEAIGEVVGPCPVRIGRFPKALYVFRVSSAVPFMKLKFGADGEPREHCEVLGLGKQFVALGRHPSGQDYEWRAPLVAIDELPLVGIEALDGIFDRLRDRLPNAGDVEKSGVGGAAGEDGTAGGRPEEGLRAAGGPEEVRRVLSAIRNAGVRFETRESYLGVGYAVRAAVGEDRVAEGLEIWSDWCASWESGDGRANDMEVVAADWARMKGPYRRGAGWLYELAEEVSGGEYRAASRWFELVEAEAGGYGGFWGSGLFPEDPEDVAARVAARVAAAERAAVVAGIRATPFDFARAAGVGPRAFVYGRHMVRKYVSATVAASKVGKTALLLGEAIAMACGKPLLGVATPPRRVWVWNGEDPEDEMQRRVLATMQLHGVTPEDIGDRLFVDSGRRTPIKLAEMGKGGATIAVPVVNALISTFLENRIDVGIFDPFISTHSVSENDNVAIDKAAKTWAYIADCSNAAIDLAHHIRKMNGEEVTLDAMRGASSLLATTRSSRAFARMSKEMAQSKGLVDQRRRLFHTVDADSNLVLLNDNDEGWFELASVHLSNGTEEYPAGDSVGAVRLFDMETATTQAEETNEDAERKALEEIASGDWRRDPRAGDAWVGCVIGNAFGIDRLAPEGRSRIISMISEWISQGKIVEETGLNEYRKPRQFVRVATKNDCF